MGVEDTVAEVVEEAVVMVDTIHITEVDVVVMDAEEGGMEVKIPLLHPHPLRPAIQVAH